MFVVIFCCSEPCKAFTVHMDRERERDKRKREGVRRGEEVKKRGEEREGSEEKEREGDPAVVKVSVDARVCE